MTAAETYLAELTSRLQAALGEELVGVYAGGSYALGEYEPGRSDLDVAAVARTAVPAELARELVTGLRHESLPCPARGLELVLYPLATARAAATGAGFSLNLNTGTGIPFKAELEPDPNEEHWYPIDRSIIAAHGVALAGPPAAEVFAPIPWTALVPVVAQALEWHEPGAARGDDVVLNAARSLRYLLEGTWSSKREAGRWALAELEDAAVVRQALAARDGDGHVDPAEAERFRQAVLARMHTSERDD